MVGDDDAQLLDRRAHRRTRPIGGLRAPTDSSHVAPEIVVAAAGVALLGAGGNGIGPPARPILPTTSVAAVTKPVPQAPV